MFQVNSGVSFIKRKQNVCEWHDKNDNILTLNMRYSKNNITYNINIITNYRGVDLHLILLLIRW